MAREIDTARVICLLAHIADGACRGFTIGAGDWPLRGFLVRIGTNAHAYVNRCPHARHPLNLGPDRFLTPDGSLILCSSHGALFEKSTGFCVAGPCAGQSLESVPVRIEAGVVMLADEVDVRSLAERD
jgi:naringenin degradation protein FdeD